MNLSPEEIQNAFQHVIETRRSIRSFSKKSIPESVVNKCIDGALLAPNSSNLQPWEFYWIRNPQARAKLNEAFLSQPAVITCAELIICVARTKTWRRSRVQMLDYFSKQNPPPPKSAIEYYRTLVPIIYNNGPLGLYSPAKRLLFFLRGLFKPTPREPVNESGMRLWAIKTCALACENLMLAFRAYGYDTCPMEGYDSRRVRKILNLPADATVVMGIAAGERTNEGVFGLQVRFERSLFVKEI